MATLGYIVPESQQSKETFHALRRTDDGMLYYTKIDKDENVSIDVSDGNPSDEQLPTSGAYVDERIALQSGATEYFTGDGSTVAYNLSAPVLNGDRIAVYVNGSLQTNKVEFSYSSPTITFNIAPFNGSQIAVGKLNKGLKNNTTDKYQQYIFEDGDATYFVDADGYLIKRENIGYNLTALASDDFDTFDSSISVNSTTYQDAV
jgi:hypothetical protein